MKMKEWIAEYIADTDEAVEVKVSRYTITAFLLFLFNLAYIITDYWNMFGSLAMKALFLALSLFLAFGWSLLGSGALRFLRYKKGWLTFLLITALMFVLNYLPLTSDLPWRGDEDYHVTKTLDLFGKVPWYAYVSILAAWCVVIWLARRKPHLAATIGGILTAGMLILYPGSKLFANIRYPFISYWGFTLPLELLSWINGPYHEILFRIIPFLSAVALAWLFQRHVVSKGVGLKILWALAVAVMPLVFYYSSILYLELPAVFLMTLACLNAETLVKKNFSEVKQNPGWYGLILAGFIKETILPFTFAFIAFRLFFAVKRLVQNENHHQDSGDFGFLNLGGRTQFILGELSFIFVTLLPNVYYLVYRWFFPASRSYGMDWSNLFNNFSDYIVIVQSWVEQFGLFLLLFIAGCVILIKQKKFSTAFLYVALFLGYSVFFHLDKEQYLGYSRFNLLLFPPLAAGAAVLVKSIVQKSRTYGALLAVVVIASSLLLSPIHRDGSKVPYWGNHLTDTSEHYFPVEEAIRYIMDGPNAKGSTLFAGVKYGYSYPFYQKKLDWQPERVNVFITSEEFDDATNLNKALILAEQEGYEFIIFFVQDRVSPQLPRDSQFRELNTFSNMGHTIVLYAR